MCNVTAEKYNHLTNRYIVDFRFPLSYEREAWREYATNTPSVKSCTAVIVTFTQ